MYRLRSLKCTYFDGKDLVGLPLSFCPFHATSGQLCDASPWVEPYEFSYHSLNRKEYHPFRFKHANKHATFLIT